MLPLSACCLPRWLPWAASWLSALGVTCWVSVAHLCIQALGPGLSPFFQQHFSGMYLMLVSSVCPDMVGGGSQHLWLERSLFPAGNVHTSESQPQLGRGERFLLGQDQKLPVVPEFFSLGRISSQPVIASVRAHHLKLTSPVSKKSIKQTNKQNEKPIGGVNLRLPVPADYPDPIFSFHSVFWIRPFRLCLWDRR